MHAECDHSNIYKSGLVTLCIKCAGIKDDHDKPWRALTDKERRRNKLLSDISMMIIKNIDDINLDEIGTGMGADILTGGGHLYYLTLQRKS